MIPLRAFRDLELVDNCLRSTIIPLHAFGYLILVDAYMSDALNQSTGHGNEKYDD